MDIQGGEGLATLGMRKLIRKQKNISIITEYWPYGLDKAGVNPQNFIKLLRKSGFDLFQLDNTAGKVLPLNETKLYKNFTIENRNYANLILHPFKKRA